MKKGSPRVTSRDVAKLANVSQSAVSRAFTPGGSISKDKRERIFTAAEALSYVPNTAASSLMTGRSNTVAIILGRIDNPFYLNALKSFLNQIQSSGRKALTFTVEANGSSDEAIMQALGHQVDGIILTAAQLSTRSISLCRAHDIPIILFNRYIPGSKAAVVRCDNVKGGKTLAEHLLAAGAKSFAIVKGDPMGTTSKDRRDGFLEGLRVGGIAQEAVTEIEGNSTYDGAFSAISEYFVRREGPLPDAIFSVSDVMAIGVIDALRYDRLLKIPQDIMVCGFDGIPEAARRPYRLTTMSQPMDRMVTETLSYLYKKEHAQSEIGLIDIKLESKLIQRDTTRPPLP